MNHHIAFQIGPLVMRWYGLLIMGGLLAAAFVADREAARRGEDPQHVWNSLTWLLVLGIIGARLYHVVSNPANSAINFNYYLQNPIKILYIWEGGLGIYGAIAGGLLAMYLYVRRHRLSFLRWADIVVVGLPLAQAIGRWGNFVNQELYGYPTTLPWGIPISAVHRLSQFADLPAEARFHPTFLYESLWNLLTFGLLLLLARRYGDRLRQGDLLLVYGVLYPLGRILVETQRPDAWTIGGIPTAQLIGAVSIILCTALLIWRHRGQTEKTGKVSIGWRGEERV